MQCTVRVERLSKETFKEQTSRPTEPRASASKSEYSMRARQTPKKVTHHTSGCKQPVVDYSQYDTSTDPPSPSKWRRKIDLKRKPSKTRIAAEKYKTKPLGGPRPVRKKDTYSPPVSTPNPVTTTDDAKPSTSGTITVAATAEETQTAIDVLLSLGTDLPCGQWAVTTTVDSLLDSYCPSLGTMAWIHQSVLLLLPLCQTMFMFTRENKLLLLLCSLDFRKSMLWSSPIIMVLGFSFFI